VFSRFVANDHGETVLSNIDRLTMARLVSNACYRFAPPFVAVIARGLNVSVGELGVALMFGEFAGLLSPLIGRRVDRANRRSGMALGMTGVAVATGAAGLSRGPVGFAAALFLLSASKVVFDTSLIVWVNDHVPYERRGEVVGVVETSWALGLFLGVSTMGLVTALTSWRWGLAVGAVAMATSALRVLRGLPAEDAHAPTVVGVRSRIPAEGWLVVIGFFALLGAAQTVGIVFGPWFEDRFGFGSGAIVAVVVAMGLVELVGSVGASRVMDRWGKEASVVRGVLVMLATCVGMVVGARTPWLAVPFVVVFFLGFEFGIVCLLPVAANIVPAASGTGLGTAVGAGTLGRAVMSSIATSLYEQSGPVAAAVLAGVLSMVAGAAVLRYRFLRQR
jgi:predicted MFS family arabinose efflux permease